MASATENLSLKKGQTTSSSLSRIPTKLLWKKQIKDSKEIATAQKDIVFWKQPTFLLDTRALVEFAKPELVYHMVGHVRYLLVSLYVIFAMLSSLERKLSKTLRYGESMTIKKICLNFKIITTHIVIPLPMNWNFIYKVKKKGNVVAVVNILNLGLRSGYVLLGVTSVARPSVSLAVLQNLVRRRRLSKE